MWRASASARKGNDVLRIVLDLKSPVVPQIFALPPVAEFGHRLVVDLYPPRPLDPLMALLEDERRKDARDPSPAPPDRLATFAGCGGRQRGQAPGRHVGAHAWRGRAQRCVAARDRAGARRAIVAAPRAVHARCTLGICYRPRPRPHQLHRR